MKRVKTTPEMRAGAVQAYIAGQQVVTIAKQLGVSRPAVYMWIQEAKGISRQTLSERVASLEARVEALELSTGKRL